MCVYSDRLVIGYFRTTKNKITILRDASIVDDKFSYEKYLRSYNYRREDHSGEFLTRITDYIYCEAPVHENGQGCKIILNYDYMDGSPCGIGKSEAAWK